jgi:hypothetical protein
MCVEAKKDAVEVDVEENENDEDTTTSSCLEWFRVSRGWAPGTALCHSGNNGRWEASVWIAPAQELILVAATNAGGASATGEATGTTTATVNVNILGRWERDQRFLRCDNKVISGGAR